LYAEKMTRECKVRIESGTGPFFGLHRVRTID
jgi:hypothetical protein